MKRLSILAIFIFIVGLGSLFLIAYLQQLGKLPPTYPAPKNVKDSYCQVLLSIPDLDCANFVTQQDAQRTYQGTIECSGYDYFRLDGDHDGIACESLR